MKRAVNLRYLIFLASLGFACAFCWYGPRIATAQNPLTPAESRGKQIYLLGTSSSGKDILAYVGEASLEVPASAMACANCHGLDGQGKPEEIGRASCRERG